MAKDGKLPKIILIRLDPDYIEQMGKSVSEFIKNSPELAVKLGLIKNEVDMFSTTKADEQNLKHKSKNDGCLCKLTVVYYLFLLNDCIYFNIFQ